jgi:hypothetical protein
MHISFRMQLRINPTRAGVYRRTSFMDQILINCLMYSSIDVRVNCVGQVSQLGTLHDTGAKDSRMLR